MVNEKRDDILESPTTYINEVLKIKNAVQQPETKLELLNILIKDYFRKKYHVRKNAGYSEMIEIFLEKKRPHLSTFCHDMVIDLYSGEKITENKINFILENAKLTLSKDLGNVNLDEKIKMKEIINPFSALKNTPVSKERILSKNARKLIETYLKTESEAQKQEEKSSEEMTEEEDLDYMKRKLSLNMKPDISDAINSNIDNPEKIENIDDFNRLKDKIKKKKSEN
jgi:hypothetical protein